MTDPGPENIILAYLRRFDEQLERLREDVLEIKGRLGMLEQQYASISNRVDRIEMRLERIEKRLDLIEA
jgi:predicted  nucleic acid-binding Zn-ribbon protein